MIAQLRETCRRLLEEGTVQVVIGYAEGGRPVFITRPEEGGRLVWNEQCVANLAAYLKRKEVRELGRTAVIVRECGERALVVLEQENQIDRRDLHVIRMEGPKQAGQSGQPQDRLALFMARPAAQRWAFWRQELARCVKCYACRQVCPLCYCERCVADKNRPVRIETSPSPRGNLAWQITRAFHHAGRCVGCGACTRACPAGIDLDLLNLSVARAAEKEFSYTAGSDACAPPLFGSWSPADKEEFIR